MDSIRTMSTMARASTPTAMEACTTGIGRKEYDQAGETSKILRATLMSAIGWTMKSTGWENSSSPMATCTKERYNTTSRTEEVLCDMLPGISLKELFSKARCRATGNIHLKTEISTSANIRYFADIVHNDKME